MSIAEKLITVAENDQTITEAVATEADLISEIQSMVDNLPEAGGDEDKWLYVSNLYETFKNATFPTNHELTLNVPFVSSITYMLYGATNIKKLTLISGDTTGDVDTISGTYCFYNTPLEELDFSNFRNGGIRFASTTKYPFQGCVRLKYIRGEIDMSDVTSALNYFKECGYLIDVRFKSGSIKASLDTVSSVLSAASIQSIVDGLADLTGQTAQTLTLHATVGAKLTQTQKDTIAAKNWTVTY